MITVKSNLPFNYFKSYFVGFAWLIFCSIFTNSCKKNDVSEVANLQVDITLLGVDENNPFGNGSGAISCIANADNAVRYGYKFDGGEMVESVDGTIEHTFSKKGINSYPVLVFAYSSNGESISRTHFVKVFRSGSDQNLIFSDEFNEEGPLDKDKWLFETTPPNNGSWWNGEKQHYTDRIDNAYVSDGTLKIVAKKEQFTFEGSTKSYTSARLNSKFDFTYGTVEVKAKLPSGEGTWPAIWTLGSNNSTVGWPTCGEIDIMEHWGHEPTNISSAIHTVACSAGSNCDQARIGEIIVDDYDTNFHVYKAEWTSDKIIFYLDDQLLYTYQPPSKTSENWPFTRNQFIILNVAMGGDWFGIDPDFNQSTMEIDYVRVYQ